MSSEIDAKPEHHEIILVGAGFAGVYGVYRLRQDGKNVLCIEAAPDVGGVWYHNCYPGARCDLLSVDYSYSFSEELQQEWQWSERYSSQAEIQRYIAHVADKFDLRRSFAFNTRVTGMRRDDATGLWTLQTSTGKSYTARHVVLTTGPLSAPADPKIPGLASFAGEFYRTSNWPHAPVSFAGKRIGVIGTGSSGVQSITEIAKTAGHITVFQRTPVFAIPSRNRAITPEESAEFKKTYSTYRQSMRASFPAAYMAATGKNTAECSPDEQRRILDELWEEGGLGFVSIFNDVLLNEDANKVVADYLREKMRGRVKDPVLAEKLLPRTYPVGAKRPCIDAGYLEVFNQANATLVDLRATPIERITPTGIQTSAGHHELDMLVLATGFDAMTGAALAINPVNGQGQALSDAWQEGPQTYLGLSIAGFPNLFTVGAAGSTSVFANVVAVAEAGIDWIADAIGWLDAHGRHVMEATEAAQAGWTAQLIEIADYSLLPRVDSWYTGANIPGKKRVVSAFLGGFPNYVGACQAVAETGYQGFVTK